MVVNALMSIPATNAHLWPAGTLPAGSVTYPGRIFVGGLSSERNPEGEVNEDDLLKFFGTFGTVTEVKKILDHEDGTFRGFAFVTFAEKETAEKIFEQYSDASQRSRFVIKGLDLKIGHAVKKGSGAAVIPNPATAAVNQLTANARAQAQSYWYNQQILAQLGNPLYCSPFYLGTGGVPAANPDPMMSLMYSNPSYANAVQQPIATTVPQVKLSSSPVATQSLNSPVSVSSTLMKLDGSPTRASLTQDMMNTLVSCGQPLSTTEQVIPVLNSMATCSDTLNPAVNNTAMLNNYNLRCQNPYAFGYLLPSQMGVSPNGSIPQNCSAPLLSPNQAAIDQSLFLNNYYSYQPQPNGFLGSPVTAIPSALNGQMDAHGIENFQNCVKNAGLNIFDVSSTKSSPIAALQTPTCLGQVGFQKHDTRDLVSFAGFTYPNPVSAPTMQVHFANSPHVEDMPIGSGMTNRSVTQLTTNME